MSSSAVKDDPCVGAAPSERLAAATGFLASRDALAMAWLDEALRPVFVLGSLIGRLPAGVSVTESVAALSGLTHDLLGLRDDPGRVFIMPGVRPQWSTEKPDLRLDFAVFYRPGEGQFLLLVTQAVFWSELEYALQAEVRARNIAEAEVAAQARVIQKTNQELSEVNRDLDAFASMISHDLRAPLRGLRYAAGDADAALASGDVEKARMDLERARARARRMSEMLTGLLDFARAGRKSDKLEQIDTHALVMEIVSSAGADATQTIDVAGSWPTIATLAEPLDIVLRNLLDNAVKHHDRAEGHIVVSCSDKPGHIEISVADDGPGIEPAWHEAIFHPFKQIADSDAVGGAGIGLALVKKTVERFGGSIRVVSDPASRRGAEFQVTWPKAISS